MITIKVKIKCTWFYKNCNLIYVNDLKLCLNVVNIVEIIASKNVTKKQKKLSAYS